MRAWLALFSAIVCEVAGTLALKVFGASAPVLAAALTGGAVVASYLLLSLAFRGIPVAVAFAVWEALGLVLVTVLGVWLLHERVAVSYTHLTLPTKA
jgi:multidrug transporter EmrE-like cation transporter